MPLDEASRRFSFLLQGDLRRFAERRQEHEARGELVKYDSVSRIANVETRRGDTTARLYGEVLATYAAHDRILRWAWAGRASSTLPTHGEVMFREGQARGVPQLTMSVVGDLDEDDAIALVKLGALVARAEGIHERRGEGDIEFVGLFERPRPEDPEQARQRISVPPPAPAATGAGASLRPSAPPRAYRSIPPVREVFEPRTGGSRPPPAGGWSNLDGPKQIGRAHV